MSATFLRGEVLSFAAEPFVDPHADPQDRSATTGLNHSADAVLTLRDGLIESIVEAEEFARAGGLIEHCEDLRGSLILPGFIDTHIHYPQMNIIGGYGARLMDWLDKYAFPAEIAYAEQPYAEAQAELRRQSVNESQCAEAAVRF